MPRVDDDQQQLLRALIVRKTRRLAVDGPPGDGAAAARQFDAVLLCAGFKCSAGLLARLSGLDPDRVTGLAAGALAVVRELAGDHVRHNTYFTGFPAGVPDTARFWAACLTEAITDPAAAAKARTVPDGQEGWAIDLLSLPSYGRYQHSFEQMLAAHEELIEALADRVTILDLAEPLETEAQALYLRLAASPVPCRPMTPGRCGSWPGRAPAGSSRIRSRSGKAARSSTLPGSAPPPCRW